MTDKRNDLLLAALRRAGKPATSDDLLDAATGLALAEGWTPEHLAWLNRKSISKRMQHLEDADQVKQKGESLDVSSRRMTPLYVPVDGYDAAAPVPTPPPAATSPTESPHAGMARAQMIVVLDVQDTMMTLLTRQIQDMQRQIQESQRFLTDFASMRERARARLMAAGVAEW